MLDALKFVQGSASKKDLIPELSHFVIENGTVRGFNGVMALCSPIPFDIKCKPKAALLVKAISNCTETVSIALTDAGKLVIRSGKFKVTVDCHPSENTPHVNPEGQHLAINGGKLLKAFKTLYPFVGNDASRLWTNGILLSGQCAYATNNITLVEHWIGATTLPFAINIPRTAVKEIIRIDEPFENCQLTENSITFHYAGGKWLRTQLLTATWPNLAKILNCENNPQPIDNRIFDGLRLLRHFTDDFGRVIFKKGRIITHEDETKGGSYNIESFDHNGTYQLEMLSLLEGVATSVDFTTYPQPCAFFGDNLRGAIIGLKS